MVLEVVEVETAAGIVERAEVPVEIAQAGARLEALEGEEVTGSQSETIEAPRPDGNEAQATATLPRVREAQPIEEPPPGSPAAPGIRTRASFTRGR